MITEPCDPPYMINPCPALYSSDSWHYCGCSLFYLFKRSNLLFIIP